MRYIIQATAVRVVDRWERHTQVPTFYVDAHNDQTARSIAERILLSGAPEAEYAIHMERAES